MFSVFEELKGAKKKFGSLEKISEEFYCQLFWNFLEGEGLQDDLLFFVSDESEVQVCRFSKGGQRPSLNIKVNWNHSLLLNLVCQMNFSLKISCCAYIEGEFSGMSQLIVEDVAIKKVYAGPIECHLDDSFQVTNKKKVKKNQFKQPPNQAQYSFPEIYFSVQDFETCFQDIVIRKDCILIVELFVTEEGKELEVCDGELKKKIFKRTDSMCIFQGAISYAALNEAYHKNVKEFGALKGSFIMMTGPDGIGEAQLNAKNIHKNGIEDDDSISFKSAFTMIKSLISTECKATTQIQSTQHYEQDAIFNCRLTFIRLHLMTLIKLLI